MKHLTISLLAGVAALGFASSTFAADLIIDEAPIAEVGIVDVGGNWDGAYIGGFVGAGWGLADHVPDGGPCAPDGCDVDLSGWLAGVTIGANFTVSEGIVAGIAADIAWTDLSGEDTFVIGDVTNNVNWEGSVRGVLGFDGGAFMPYLTAGLAVANASHWSDFADAEADVTHFGWTAGLGVAVQVADNITLDLQYRHSWYNEQTYDLGLGPINPVFGLQTDRVTAGVNFNF